MGYNFTDYMLEYNKSYVTAEELAIRQSYFNDNYSHILAINSQNLGYELSVNQMTDWSQAEVSGKKKLIQQDSDSYQAETVLVDSRRPP